MKESMASASAPAGIIEMECREKIEQMAKVFS